MHRLSILFFTLTLATGCTTADDAYLASAQNSNPIFAADPQCDAVGVQSYVGQSWRETLAVDLRRTASSQTLRILKPGQVMTLELNPYRLNVVIDAQNKMTKLYCG